MNYIIKRIFYSNKNKDNIVGIIICTKDANDMNYNVYKNGSDGLKRIDLNGNHSYLPFTTKQLIETFLNDYTNSYFNDCYYEEE